MRQGLSQLRGVEVLAKYMEGVEASLRVRGRRRRAGLRVGTVSRHVAMVGNPGTGKTTAARLLGTLYSSLGELPQGHLVEATRGDLVGEYMGATSIKTRAVIDSARGGVLFIDEAYSLALGEGLYDYGKEAIEELLSAMENHRDNLVVVVAGYEREMDRFLDSNAGLRSRFATKISFRDLTDMELALIVQDLARANDYEFAVGTKEAVRMAFSNYPRDRNFGNGRSARNLFEAMVTTHAQRVSTQPTSSLTALQPDDLPAQPTW